MTTKFFENFPKVEYSFGDNEPLVKFQDLSVYIDAIDQVKEYSSFYQSYQVQNNERPDHSSFKLYGTTDFYWTFWLMNDTVREQGWPITNSQIYSQAQEYYPNIVVRSDGVAVDNSDFSTRPLAAAASIVVGACVWFEQDNRIGKVLRIDQDLGLIHINLSGKTTQTSTISVISKEDADNMAAGLITTPTVLESTAIVEVYDQWDAPHHYETAEGDWVKPQWSSTAPYPFDWTSVTTQQSVSYFQRLREENDKLRSIQVIKPDSINQVLSEFNRLLKSR